MIETFKFKVANHIVHGNHAAYSKIFYNDGKRFKNPRAEKIPTTGPHWSNNEDMGHIYNRSWQQTYESSVFHLTKKRTMGNISFIADIPTGTQPVFEVRTSVIEKELSGKKWTKVSDSGNFEVKSLDKFLHYRAVFILDNSDRFPVLDKVVVELNK